MACAQTFFSFIHTKMHYLAGNVSALRPFSCTLRSDVGTYMYSEARMSLRTRPMPYLCTDIGIYVQRH